MGKPLVSINICTYNRSNLVKKAIESAITQDYPNLEIIVADNGSDNTSEIINDIVHKHPNSTIKYFKNNADGISENRNFALEHSQGKYIAILDSDDYWIEPTKISQQVKFLEENNDHIIVGTNAVVVDSKDKKIGEILNEISDKKIRTNILLKNHFVHSSVLYKKNTSNKYDESIFIWEDYELFLRLTHKSKVANLPNKMTAYRKHGGNISTKNKIRGVQTLSQILRRNKNNYPKYYRAVLKNWVRMIRALLPF